MLKRLLQITLLIGFGVTCVVALADIGRIAIQSGRPDLALTLAPLNADVRIALIGRRLTGRERMVEAEDLAGEGRALHRADGRFDSLLGIMAHERGDLAAARTHFEAALAKQPAEFQALRHLIAYDVADGRWEEAAQLTAVFGQRWSRRWEDQERAVLMIAENPIGRAALIDGMMTAPEGRQALVNILLRADRPLVAGEFLAAWYASGVRDLTTETRRVTQRLLNEGNTETAMLLDRVTLGAGRPPPQGFVNNGQFAFLPSGSVFDWTARPQPGVSFEWTGQERPGAGQIDSRAGRQTDAFVRLRFGDSPLRMDNLKQALVMRPGPHRLVVTARANRLTAPRPLQVIVGCERAVIGQLVLDPLTDDWQDYTTTFIVPADCPMQTISVSNGFMPLSWSMRYKGTLDIAQVQIIGSP